ncbi:MAG: DUF2779 domain-containing protein [Blastocatellia bacterium]|nr:DUF2779 domain-containing protein [Blastocatellia bacterium]
MKDRLTKTGYLRYLKCPPEYWMWAKEPLLETQPLTLEAEHLRQQGYEVQRLARRLAIFQSTAEMAVDFERTFQTEEFLARADIVVTDQTTGSIDFYEVKSTSAIKEEHYDDLAFQKLTALKAGATVVRSFVLTMNADYVRRGEIDPEKLFVIHDVTENVDARLEITEQYAHLAIRCLDEVPVPSLLDYCKENKLDCEFLKQHFPDLPDYTIFDISYLKTDKRRDLLSQGIVAVIDVPDDFPLSDKQRIQVEAAKSGVITIDVNEIEKRMSQWQYPLHFLDYETFAYAIPQFDGIKPYQQMCFQYSLHTIDALKAATRHSWYLSRGDDLTPPRLLVEALRESMSGGIGTVLVWYEAFEKGRNSEMAEMFPEHAEFLNEINAKTFDLMKIFSDRLYIHPEFKGRNSIKKVLPVLVPELSYDNLGVGEGMTATIKWFRAVKWDSLDDAEREQIFTDLDAYCFQDTLAMVRIVERLRALESASQQAASSY